MAKCAKCSQRKGKRSCPALHALICPQCCGTYRLSVIRCPPDCEYLEGTVRRRQREEERSDAALEVYTKDRIGTFSTAEDRYCAHLFESAAFRWWKEHRQATVEDIAQSYERASRMLSRITLPGDNRDPLAAILAQGPDMVPAFQAIEAQPRYEFFVRILRRLAAFARDYEKRTSPWKGYYRALGYAFAHTGPPAAEDRRASTIILPGQNPPHAPGGLIVAPDQ